MKDLVDCVSFGRPHRVVSLALASPLFCHRRLSPLDANIYFKWGSKSCTGGTFDSSACLLAADFIFLIEKRLVVAVVGCLYSTRPPPLLLLPLFTVPDPCNFSSIACVYLVDEAFLCAGYIFPTANVKARLNIAN